MKLRRLITRRRAKWVGLVLCVLLAAVFVASRWMGIGAQTLSTQGVHWDASVERGRLALYEEVSPDVTVPERRSSFRVWFNVPPTLNLWIDWSHRALINGDRVRRVRVPFWMPLLLLAVPTVWLWRADRRAKPWQCAKCRYDLRGLEGGVCPECGEPTTETPA